MVLVEDPISQKKRYIEMRKNAQMEKAAKSTSEISLEVDRLAGQSEDTYDKVAQKSYVNLTTADWVQRFNIYDPSRIPDSGTLNVTVNCSCGDSLISKDYGLFVTYPLQPGETLDSVSSAAKLSYDLIRRYNSVPI
ncbi:putative non-specific serine/threonine protein kinase [Helianthus debilis subsp. tardiflorus]